MRRLLILLLLVLPGLAFAEAKPVPVALTNPGFEDELKGWDNADAPEMVGAFTLAHDAQHSGKASLHVQPQVSGQSPWVSQKIAKVDPGKIYAARVWFRGAEQGDTNAGLKLEYLDETGTAIGGRYVRRPLPVGTWAQMAVAEMAPAKAVSARLYLRVFGAAETWFDDVEMVQAGETPAVAASPLRLALQPGQPKSVHLEVTSQAELAEGPAPKLAIIDSAGKEIKAVKGELTRKDAHTLAGDFELPGLLPGTHAWRVKLPQGQAEGRLYVALAKRQPKYLTDQGFLKIGANSVFPIGIYHVSVEDYELLGQRGFNAVQGLVSQDSRQLKQALTEAAKHKLLTDMPLHLGGLVAANLVASQQKLQYFAKDQTITDWQIADEPDRRPEIADEIPETYQRLKQKDELRPLQLTVDQPEQYEYWANFCDSLQVVCFPLPSQPLTLVSDRVAAARKVLQPWQHLSVLLQAGWIAGGANQPSLEQARVMLYLAVINGAQGIYWYSMRDPGWQLPDSGLWEKFGEINEETARLGEAVMGGPKAAVECDNAKLQAAAWGSGGGYQLMVVNPGAEPQTALIKLPQAAAKTVIAKGKAELEIKDGALALTLEPLQAVLVTVQTSATPEAPPATKAAPETKAVPQAQPTAPPPGGPGGPPPPPPPGDGGK